MSTTKAPGSPPENPAEIAREAFKRLAVQRIAPTPQNYTIIYNQIAGIEEPVPAPVAAEPAEASAPVDDGATTLLADFAAKLIEQPGELAEYGRRFQRAAKAADWEGYARNLNQFVEKHFRKTNTIELAAPAEAPDTKQLREMLARSLNFAVASLLEGSPELVAEAEALGSELKVIQDEASLADVSARLKQLCYRIEIKTGDLAEQQELLMRLFKLLLENVSELLDEDSWLRGQVDVVQELISGPIDPRALEEATRSLKEVIYKQGQLKHSLSDVKVTVKNMMMTFIDRLGSVATSTGDYHEKIGGLSERIGHAKDITELNEIMDELLRETRNIQTEALQSRDRMILARQEVQEAEQRIHALEAKLQHMSELVREDQLTGSLNRRGLDDVFERETARSDRRGTPLCIALLDLDDFKRLNDTYGHQAGDAALKHLVKIVKETLRSMDVIARYGGEEFLILLPETTVDAASQTMTRLQRELTKHFFLHDNEKVLITFSAGVALRQPNEDQGALVKRADKAMYEAKKTGKNRVVVAS
ncbi:GGDEF domain-containing protein [Massilia sp. CF038]|uniref:GGDEF domain-containing protein n=1 Tax=Massilia sp. CF038 TaxID=1881045 RepID=UPI00091ECDB6|nr:GGDEF domain-containing protein [Massilia sp. CF038]SHG45151.1 diguanylate cyclase [Massilia sp. CF038]